MASKKFKKGYVSEFTRFIDGYLNAHPEVADDQRRGWYIYWDHHVDLKDIEREMTENLPYEPYP